MEQSSKSHDVATATGQATMNVAVFDGGTDANATVGADLSVLPDGLATLAGYEHDVVISDSAAFLRDVDASLRLSSAEVGLDAEPANADTVLAALQNGLGEKQQKTGIRILVDMRWATKKVHGTGSLERWGAVCESICSALNAAVVSCYNRELVLEDQLQSVFQAHRQFLARSGLHENPYWLPESLQSVSKSEQMSFLLGRVIPDYEGRHLFERDDRFAVHGADPEWLRRERGVSLSAPAQDAWQIYCFGQLRVYRAGGERIEWKIKGGAPKKARSLFAYLLTHGEKGAHADRIAELLWPKSGSEENKRARLHHTVAMLRKTLGSPNAVLRSGDFYRLNAPEGTWVDITAFEQMCRRGVTLFRRGQRDEAIELYRTAEQLYAGDLFEDIPVEYVDDEQEDWCKPRRVWLREVALKLQRDTSALLREQGKLRQALEHCQKALALDPSSDAANTEAMLVYHAQGRMDAVARQYQQYRKAMETIAATPEGSEVHALFLALTRR